MGLSDDSLLKPFRAMAGQPAPGVDIGGWYQYLPTYNYKTGDAGFAPGHSFGQWTSALARFASANNDAVIANRVRALHAQLAEAISPAFFDQTRFPAYTLDRLVCGLMDGHALLQDSQAFPTLDKVLAAALPSLPGRAIPREAAWRPDRDASFHWDESYTLPENLYLVSTMGAGRAYREMADQYLLNTFFDPLARNENVLGGLHAYSHVNALCSAMQAWFVTGSEPHLRAAVNGFRMLEAQSYSTGGWGPEETLGKPGSGRLYNSLTETHNSFETPCGAYAHMKLTRYLLQATRDGHYGDSMECVMLNAALGALPLGGDGRSFYNADFSAAGRRVYSKHRWPCCSGTLPQLAADYGINAYLLGAERDPSVWVNLYLASRLSWSHHGMRLSLEQQPGYPDQPLVSMRFKSLRPVKLSVHLRIPDWADKSHLAINGQSIPIHSVRGFTEIRRTWKSGDIIELELPMPLRLEPLRTDGGTPHPEITSILCGPRVLMAMGPQPTLTREQALSARRISTSEWVAQTGYREIHLRPFTHVGDELYSPYIRLAT